MDAPWLSAESCGNSELWIGGLRPLMPSYVTRAAKEQALAFLHDSLIGEKKAAEQEGRAIYGGPHSN